MEVGIRELRAQLSRYLDRVRAGEDLIVTDRGTAIARIVPMNGQRKIDRLIALGLVSAAPKPKGPPPRPVKARGTVSEVVSMQRR